jgi:hypothetical protein
MTSSFVPITRHRHGSLRWKRPRDLHRASTSALLPLVLPELVRAQAALPIAFVPHLDSFRPVAVGGLRTGKSLFVSPDGRWLARYVPAVLRSYPFAIGQSEDDKKILLVLEPDGLAGEPGIGEPFFEDDKPAGVVSEILNFLIEMDRAEQATHKAVEALRAQDLLEPWPIRLTLGGKAEDIQGLYRVHEKQLNDLAADAFAGLRESGALLLAYSQLMSMQNLPDLVKLAEAHAEHEGRVPINQKGELDLEFLNHGGSLDFGAINAT